MFRNSSESMFRNSLNFAPEKKKTVLISLIQTIQILGIRTFWNDGYCGLPTVGCKQLIGQNGD